MVILRLRKNGDKQDFHEMIVVIDNLIKKNKKLKFHM